MAIDKVQRVAFYQINLFDLNPDSALDFVMRENMISSFRRDIEEEKMRTEVNMKSDFFVINF